MDRTVSDLILVTVSVSIICAAALAGYWLSLRSRREQHGELPSAAEDVQAELDTFRAEVSAQIAELHERLDFAERLLSRPSPHERPPNGPPATPGPE